MFNRILSKLGIKKKRKQNQKTPSVRSQNNSEKTDSSYNYTKPEPFLNETENIRPPLVEAETTLFPDETTTSVSARLRQEGNTIYIQAKEGLPLLIQRDRLQKAFNLYYDAHNAGETKDETVSAAKNLGMVSWRLAKVSESSTDRSNVAFYHFKETLKYLSEAWQSSCNVKTNEWRDNVCASALQCWQDFKKGRLNGLDFETRLKVLYDVLQKTEIPSIKARSYLYIANCHFHAGVTALQKKDFKKTLHHMKECHMPMSEAAAYGRTLSLLHIQNETSTLEKDVLMQRYIAESMQANHTADLLLNKQLMDEENINIDMIYEIIDWYKQAVLLTREMTEVEMEAVAMSRIGRVYDKVFKLKYKAKEYLLKSMQLANSMHPRIFNGEDWFEDCKAILERYQQETLQQESEQWQKDREVYLKELETELKDLKENDIQWQNSKSEGFLKYLYPKFPPTNPDHKLEGVPDDGKCEDGQLKKLLQKAIIHYHPDKVDVEKHGKKRKVLGEEITKLLTRRYEAFKL